MREIPLSNSERKFITKALTELKRLDGRKLDQFRDFKIHFGNDWGSCIVTLGRTMVVAHVSCQIQEPRITRPNEGLLFLNVDVTPMAAPNFEAGGRSDLAVYLNRMLEKCLKEAKAVDLEALCIVSDEKVWELRVDVNIINHEGNILDCASTAALAALAHFKRPDVTTDGEEITVHDPTERDPIPITLHHYPTCVSFGIFSEIEAVVSDPSALEERVADASLVFGVNAYRELCALHLGGSAVLSSSEIHRCGIKAALRAKQVVDKIKESLIADNEQRLSGKPIGFAECLELDKITALSQERLKIQLGKFKLGQPLDIHLEERIFKENAMDVDEAEEMESEPEEFTVTDLGDNSAELVSTNKATDIKKAVPKSVRYGEGGPSQWVVDVDVAPSVPLENDDDDIAVIDPPPRKTPLKIELSDGSDEEVVVLDSSALALSEKVRLLKGKGEVQQNKGKSKRKKQKGKNRI